MRRKQRDIRFDLLGLPDDQTTFSDLPIAHAETVGKEQIPSNNRKKRDPSTSTEGCTV